MTVVVTSAIEFGDVFVINIMWWDIFDKNRLSGSSHAYNRNTKRNFTTEKQELHKRCWCWVIGKLILTDYNMDKWKSNLNLSTTELFFVYQVVGYVEYLVYC